MSEKKGCTLILEAVESVKQKHLLRTENVSQI